MKRGLVIGKFMPIHDGHIALINFAASKCDELIVSMSHAYDDPISGEIRFSWVKEIFKDRSNIKASMVLDDFDDESLPWTDRTKIWAAFIKKTYPSVDIIFSSEEYGEPFAKNLGVQHRLFDMQRTQTPVSATLIRSNPFRYWDFIPAVVRPYFVKKVCFYGPESTGKSTMTERMAEIYQTEFVPEVARELITSNEFGVDDIIKIGKEHLKRIDVKLKTANKILFCDSDAITTQIYSAHYLGVVPPVLYEMEKKVKYDRYFLFDIDTPWIPDGLRDLGHIRQEMLETFKTELSRRSIDFIWVRGDWDKREQIIRSEVNKLLT